MHRRYHTPNKSRSLAAGFASWPVVIAIILIAIFTISLFVYAEPFYFQADSLFNKQQALADSTRAAIKITAAILMAFGFITTWLLNSILNELKEINRRENKKINY